MGKNNIKKVLTIEGMTCTGCETRIENVVSKLKGIIEVKAVYSSQKVYVTFDGDEATIEDIIAAIERLDYRVTSTAHEGLSSGKSKKTDAAQLIGIGIILFALYTIIKNTVGFNFIPQVDQSTGFGILFVIGLITSLHCVAMCGGINLSVCVNYRVTESSSKSASFLYNGGRVLSYTIVGGLVGALGSVISFSGTAKGIIAVISGFFMVIMGLNMLNVFPWLRKFNPRMPKFIGKKLHSGSSSKGPFWVGIVNGLMPCGPLQAMQLYALGTGSFAAGALSMFLFSLGTVPLMFGFGAVSSFLSGKFTHRMLKVSAVLVMILGLIMFNRGLSLSGINIASAASINSDKGNIAKVENGVQYVTTELEPGSYTPILVQKGIPVKWTIKVEDGDLNGCNNPVTIPKYNMQVKLKNGDNIIEFTPQEEGNIVYTCWMGMIRSNIKVVNDLSSVSAKDLTGLNDGSSQESAQGAAGGCCAAGSKATKFADVKISTDQVAVGKIVNGLQTVSITVNDYGFSPAVIVMQKGVKTNFIINGEKLNYCNNKLVFPDYGASMDLKEGKNVIEFVPDQDFNFSCWMGMLNGYIKVVDNINNIDIDAIKKEVDSYVPAAGSAGGCCGN